MKRLLYFGLSGYIAASMMVSCANGNKSAASVTDVDSVFVTKGTETVETDLFDKWFIDFQEENPHWTRTTEGHEKLTKAFEKEMKSNLEFAKSVCQDKAFISECISSYDRKDGEHGGIWSFVFIKNVTLKNPLYNGQTEVELAYEIFSTIPATEPHERPYLKNVNYSDKFNSYHDINYSGTLNLGSYIVTKKDK